MVIWGCPSLVLAQITNDLTPSATQERNREAQEFFETQKTLQEETFRKERAVLEVDEGTEGTAVEQDKPVSLILKEVIFSSSKILNQRELKSVSAPYIEKSVSFLELNQITEAINALYQEKNYPTARAILPPQDIKDGVVKIELIEGTLGRIILKGNDSTHAHFILKHLQVESGELLDIQTIEQDLIRFNALYDTRLNAQLSKGETFGTTDLVLTVSEPPRNEGLLYSDNLGQEETGLERGGFTFTYNSITGRRDSLVFGGV
ncbi:MAG: ShlB/FhaC/HecB family hemolysin secretion/activation protein, partial [Candidatus Omnitrophica bacterium]|nr:ShlB/FhaC/HecB family hemolysin secretion/activation protein [Candidatus Omnitrophota bacterium]